eukprot:6471727-Amphidinium_carterae.1
MVEREGVERLEGKPSLWKLGLTWLPFSTLWKVKDGGRKICRTCFILCYQRRGPPSKARGDPSPCSPWFTGFGRPRSVLGFVIGGNAVDRKERPVGNGALDEALALAIEVEEHTLRGEPAAAVFLDCRCVPLRILFGCAGIPLHIARAAIGMYSAARGVLVGGALSRSFRSRNGIPPGCGLAVDFLHCFLLKNGGSKLPPGITMRKYVDDMDHVTWLSKLHETSEVAPNGRHHQGSRSCCKPIRARIVRALQPMALCGSEVIGMSEASLGSIRASTRKALGSVGKRSSEIDFIAKGGPQLDPRVALDQAIIKKGMGQEGGGQPHHLASEG